MLTWGKPPIRASAEAFPEPGTPAHMKPDAEVFEACRHAATTRISLAPLSGEDLAYPWDKLGPPGELPDGRWNGAFAACDEDMVNSWAYRKRVSEYEKSLREIKVTHPYTGVVWTRGPWSWSVDKKDDDMAVAEHFADSDDPEWVVLSEAIYYAYGYDSTCRKIVAYAKWKRKQPKGHWANP